MSCNPHKAVRTFGGDYDLLATWSSEPFFNLARTIQNLIILHDTERSDTAAVMDLLRRWQWQILEHPPYSPDMSPCDYDLFAKVKEPLRGTRYNTRDELIRAIGRSIRNINKDGCADGVRRLPNIWKK